MTYAPPSLLTQLACKWFGHKWQAIKPETKASILLVCLRCNENAWRVW